MISIQNPQLYSAALSSLRQGVGQRYRGKVVQLFLGIKRYPADFPLIGTTTGVLTGRIQTLLDELYSRPSRPAASRVASIFSNSHLSTTSNIWRNALGLQKPAKCYATTSELLDPIFRNTSRVYCPHLVLPQGVQAGQPTQATLDDAGCDLYPDARYRGEDGIKMLRQDPQSLEFFVYDPGDSEYYSRLVVPRNGIRLPIAAIVSALYFDSTVAAGRTAIDLDAFMADFHMDPSELTTYFDDDPLSAANAALASAFGLSWTRAADIDAQNLMPPATVTQGATILPGATTVAPAVGDWWSAERAVQKTLESAGWKVLDYSPYGQGYDLLAIKGQRHLRVEVKSSTGACSVTLTDNEHKSAVQFGNDYVIAILDNFDPTKSAAIKWVYNPSAIATTQRQTVAHYLKRSSFLPVAQSATP